MASSFDATNPPKPVEAFAGGVPTEEELEQLFAYFWYELCREAEAKKQMGVGQRMAREGRTKKNDNVEYANRAYGPTIERIRRDPGLWQLFASLYLAHLSSKAVGADKGKYFQATVLAIQDLGREAPRPRPRPRKSDSRDFED